MIKNQRSLFHSVSYLQYPLLLVAIYYCSRPFFNDLNSIWIDYNKCLVFLGLGISFSTLQDTTKTQNKASKKIWENPGYAKLFLLALVMQIVVFIGLGIYGMYFSSIQALADLSFGLISVGIGIIGMLKGAIEITEHLQKNVATSDEQNKVEVV